MNRIVPHKIFINLASKQSNLQPLCKDCEDNYSTSQENFHNRRSGYSTLGFVKPTLGLG